MDRRGASVIIELEDLQQGYVDVVNKVSNCGQITYPRGLKTVEIIGAELIIKNPAKAIPVGVGRTLNTAIGAAESLQLLAGVSDADQLVRISKNFKPFVVNHRFPGAYGPRTAAQFLRVIKALENDRDSRQAEVVIWRPWDLAMKSPDVPCTISIGFVIRNDKLNMFVNMRSNDVIWGLAYDAWMFANVQKAMATALAVDVGNYYHFAGSLHLYVERDQEILGKLHPPDSKMEIPPLFTSSMEPRKNGAKPIYRWSRITEYARRSLRCPRRAMGDATPPYVPSMKWYYDRLVKFPSEGLRCHLCRYILPRTNEFFQINPADTCYRRWTRAICRECMRARRRGATREEVEAIRFMQQNKCGICGRPNGERKLVLDHDHETNKFRGWLCRSCNAALGMMGEENLSNAVSYLNNVRESLGA